MSFYRCILTLACFLYTRTTYFLRLCETVFETFGAPAFFLSKDAVLACYACGRTSGLVVDAGAGGTTITPVLDGWVESKAINRSAIGGRYLDALGLSALHGKGVSPTPAFMFRKTVSHERVVNIIPNSLVKSVHASYKAMTTLDIGRDYKESVSRIVEDLEAIKFGNMPSIPYELPDGTMIEVGEERFQVPELLFDSTAFAIDEVSLSYLNAIGFGPSTHKAYPASADPIPNLICDSVFKCETESHTPLLGNLIVTGGSSTFENMPDRMRSEVEKIVHQSAPGLRVRGISPGRSERAISAWLGGSILASLGSFHEMWMTKQEYEEHGSSLVERKCP
jgi:actin-like protein 6A